MVLGEALAEGARDPVGESGPVVFARDRSKMCIRSAPHPNAYLHEAGIQIAVRRG